MILDPIKPIENMAKEFLDMSNKWKITIIVLVVLLAAAIVSSGVTGCSTPAGAYVNANYQNANVALPDLIGYIEKDEKLDELNKTVRVKAVQEWWDLIKKAYHDYYNTENQGE